MLLREKCILLEYTIFEWLLMEKDAQKGLTGQN